MHIQLNGEQAKHLAGTFRIIALGEFGIVGYQRILAFPQHWFLLLWSSILFVVMEWFALRTLRTES